jgi:hypothetical protein
LTSVLVRDADWCATFDHDDTELAHAVEHGAPTRLDVAAVAERVHAAVPPLPS